VSSDNKSINVLFVNDHLGFADGVIHGPARYFLNILKCFDPERVNPNLCILREWHPFADEMAKEGINPVFLSRSKWDPYVIIDLVKIVRKEKIDILHLAGMKGCLIGRIVSRITGIPSVIHFRDMNPEGAVTRFLQRSVSSWTDYALAVSEPIRDFAISKYAVEGNRVEVLHNPISEELLNNTYNSRERIRSEFNITSDSQVVAIIGRLSPEKGHELLIKVLPELIDACPKIVLLVVGDGPLMNDCKALVQEIYLEKHVRFTGHRSDVPDILSAVDVVVMPSLREGFPNVALEAIAAGKPVVGFRVGGLPEIVINGQTGFLADPGQIDSIVEYLITVLTNETLSESLRTECMKHAKHFTVGKHINRLQEIYGKLITGR
jgi:glycosyltransferase involved in cell wall biosynthesis